MKTIRGVNLGGWLVLEKWMTPELFDGYDVEDEYHLLEQLGSKKHDLIRHHRETFITEEDFKWIKAYGLDTVRLPVGHWLFEDSGPYLNAMDDVIRAFRYAKRYDLNVLLDVHAAPGCQNGFDNGGLSGVVDWPKGDNIPKTLDFIRRLADRFGQEEALLGFEVLNEPRWDLDLALIQHFYEDAYDIIRHHAKPECLVVFHDAFRLDEWRDFFRRNDFHHVMLDTHMYQVFSDRDRSRTPLETIEKVAVSRAEEIRSIDDVPLIIGEWSVGIHPNTLKQLKDAFQKDVLYKAMGHLLLLTYEQAAGWFFWNYKLSETSTRRHPGWSFRDIVLKGYLPNKIEGEKI